MADALQSKRYNALEFLDELDGKHDYLLTELDALNARIDTILAEYAKSRQAVAGVSAAQRLGVQVQGRQVNDNLSVAAKEDVVPQSVTEDASGAPSPANSKQPVKSTQFNASSSR